MARQNLKWIWNELGNLTEYFNILLICYKITNCQLIFFKSHSSLAQVVYWKDYPIWYGIPNINVHHAEYQGVLPEDPFFIIGFPSPCLGILRELTAMLFISPALCFRSLICQVCPHLRNRKRKGKIGKWLHCCNCKMGPKNLWFESQYFLWLLK